MLKLCIIHIFMTNISEVMIFIGTVCHREFFLVTCRVNLCTYRRSPHTARNDLLQICHILGGIGGLDAIVDIRT